MVIHGFSDHVDRYYDFFPYLAGRGIAVYGFDQRGWGRSSAGARGARGKTGPTARVLADMAAFVEQTLSSPVESGDDNNNNNNTPLPLFLLGHSMGGGQALALAGTPAYAALASRVRGWVLEAPFLGFAPELQPHWLTVAGGRLASHLIPGFHLVRGVPPEHVSRDPAVQRSLAADDLCHDTGTLEGLAGMLDRTEQLARGALAPRPDVVKSLLLLHGTADKATSFDRAKDWFERQAAPQLKDATFKAYEGMYHQLHADYGKETFYQDVADWILARVDGDGGGVSKEGETETAAAAATPPEPKL